METPTPTEFVLQKRQFIGWKTIKRTESMSEIQDILTQAIVENPKKLFKGNYRVLWEEKT